MRSVIFKAVPYKKEEVTLALESGVDGLIVPDEHVKAAQSLARCDVYPESRVSFVALASKEDERRAGDLARAGQSETQGGSLLTILLRGWEIIPLENLLASAPNICVEAGSLDEAKLAGGVLERGVDRIIATPGSLPELKAMVAAHKFSAGHLELSPARITRIVPAGMGHRVCVDTTSLLKRGQGMLVGNSAAFTFLVNAETEHNEYVAARPFRINAGGVHAYCCLPEDATAYLEELQAGREVLIVGHTGESTTATVGRVKTERRPMLLVEARLEESGATGTVILQNAETIRLVTPEGGAASVVELKEGDRVLCRADVAGRHFGMRITEDITEE